MYNQLAAQIRASLNKSGGTDTIGRHTEAELRVFAQATLDEFDRPEDVDKVIERANADAFFGDLHTLIEPRFGMAVIMAANAIRLDAQQAMKEELDAFVDEREFPDPDDDAPSLEASEVFDNHASHIAAALRPY